MQVKLPSRKSKVERLLDNAVDAAAAGASTASDSIRKAGKSTLLVAAGLAGIAAANAGVSSLRKREG